jgi:hypothetical protein
MDKFDKTFINFAPDGKSEITPGNEPLQKDPEQLRPKRKKKNKDGIIELRWKNLKKALENAKAILDLREEAQDDEEQPEETEDAQDQAQPQDSGVRETPAEVEGGENTKQAATRNADDDEMSKGDDDDGGDEESNKAEEEQLTQQMKDAGYSDAEIAYVVHGHHSPEIDVAKDAKAKATNAMSGVDVDNAKSEAQQKLEAAKMMSQQELEHKKRMSDLEYNKSSMDMPDPEMDKKHKQRMSDLEYESKKADMPNPEHKRRMEDIEYESAKSSMPNNEAEVAHKKRMLDLEYEVAKEAKKLELEFKKKEHEHKLKMAEEAAKQRKVESHAKHKVKLADAKKPKPKTLKKNDEDEEAYDDHDQCDDPECDQCYENVEKDDTDSPYSKRSMQVQRFRNQGSDAMAAQRAAMKPHDYSGAPSTSTPYVDVPQTGTIKPNLPKVPVEKTDADDPSHTPSFDNKSLRNQQRRNRRDEVQIEDEVPKKLSLPTDAKVPYYDIGTRPTPATPATHPKLR